MSTGIDLGINALLASADAGKDLWNVQGLNLGLLIIRVVVGVTLATHGLNKIFAVAKLLEPPVGLALWV